MQSTLLVLFLIGKKRQLEQLLGKVNIALESVPVWE